MATNTLTLKIEIDDLTLSRFEDLVQRLESATSLLDICDPAPIKVEVVNTVQTTEAYPGR